MEVTHQIWWWDLADGKPLPALRDLPDEAVCSLAFSPDGKLLAAAPGNPYQPRPPRETKDDRANKGGVYVWNLAGDK